MKCLVNEIGGDTLRRVENVKVKDAYTGDFGRLNVGRLPFPLGPPLDAVSCSSECISDSRWPGIPRSSSRKQTMECAQTILSSVSAGP